MKQKFEVIGESVNTVVEADSVIEAIQIVKSSIDTSKYVVVSEGTRIVVKEMTYG